MNHWYLTDKGDPDCRRLADRHYTRQTPGSPHWCRPGHNLVLWAPAAVFVWWVPAREVGASRMDHIDAVECTIFRNESPALSSDMVRDAVACVLNWEHVRPGDMVVTAVGGAATARRRSRRALPGQCFRMAGWAEWDHKSTNAALTWLRAVAPWPDARRPQRRPEATLPLWPEVLS